MQGGRGERDRFQKTTPCKVRNRESGSIQAGTRGEPVLQVVLKSLKRGIGVLDDPELLGHLTENKRPRQHEPSAHHLYRFCGAMFALVHQDAE